MGRSTPGLNIKVTTNSYLKMNKLFLIFLGVLAIAAIVSAWDNEEDSSLSEELASSRLVRSAGNRRKNARKGRKGGKGKKAGNRKKARKGRKGRKAKKGKKGRKGRKGQGRKSQSGARSDGRASATCFDTSHTIMKIWRDLVINFDKQSKRMEKQNGTGLSKHSKKGEFVAVVHRLLSVGGGNKSAPSCSGSTTNPGAAQLKNLTDSLHECETSVDMACNSTNFEILVNDTKLVQCHAV